MNRTIVLVFALVSISAFTSCRRLNVPKVENISPSETAYLVPLEPDGSGQVKFDSESYLASNKISTGRVEIPQRWRKTGYWWLSGEYIPTKKLIKVDRAPVTIQIEAPEVNGAAVKRQNDKSIWIESKDSVGFSVGFNVSAFIEAENAAKFLYLYAGRPLADVMNTEIHGRILEVSQSFAAQYILDELREKKGEMSMKIQEEVTAFFKPRGITITNIGMYGGFSYENPKIQESIDAVFVAQQEKNTTKAKMEAQASINERVISEAKGKATAAQEEAEGKAKAILIESEAKAKAIMLETEALAQAQSNPLYLEIQKLNVAKQMTTTWDGKYPATWISSSDVSTILSAPGLAPVIQPKQ